MFLIWVPLPLSWSSSFENWLSIRVVAGLIKLLVESLGGLPASYFSDNRNSSFCTVYRSKLDQTPSFFSLTLPSLADCGSWLFLSSKCTPMSGLVSRELLSLRVKFSSVYCCVGFNGLSLPLPDMLTTVLKGVVSLTFKEAMPMFGPPVLLLKFLIECVRPGKLPSKSFYWPLLLTVWVSLVSLSPLMTLRMDYFFSSLWAWFIKSSSLGR